MTFSTSRNLFFTQTHDASCLQVNKPVSEELTAILPIRIAMPDENITLDIKFSVGLLRICISNVNGRKMAEPNQNSRFFAFKILQKRITSLDPDFLFNFWFIKYLSAILPVNVTKTLLSSQNTMVFSNIYGPQKVRILNNLVFWVLNKYFVFNRKEQSDSKKVNIYIINCISRFLEIQQLSAFLY